MRKPSQKQGECLPHYHYFTVRESIHYAIKQLEKIMATLDDVVSKVAALTTVEDSVIALLTDIKSKLDAAIAANDPAKLKAVSDAIGAQTDRLSEAVVANTPAA